MNSNNPFDKASRYLLKLAPVEFLSWAIGREPIARQFRRWIDSRRVVLPGETDRISDLVAELELAPGDNWAVICEVNRSPRAEMFGRMLVYLGLLWLEVPPTNQRGERYSVVGMVVNLVGRGNGSRRHELVESIFTHLSVREINLIDYDAAETLDRVDAGSVPVILLPWIPLMQRGSEVEVRSRWREIAGREGNAKRRADYGALVLTFANLAGTLEAWQETLEGWNVEVSEFINRFEEKAEKRGLERGEKIGLIRGQLNSLVKLLDLRFPGGLTPIVRERIYSLTDAAVADQLLASAATCGDFASFVSAFDSLAK